MTTAKNRYLSPVDDVYPALPVITSVDINQGDLVYWDGTNYTLKPCASSSDVEDVFVGVAENGTPIQVYNEAGDQRAITVRRQGRFRFNTVSGQDYDVGALVTVGTDAQTVTPASATTTNAVGRVVGPLPVTPRPSQATPVPESTAGGTGVEVEVVIMPQYPTLRS